LRRSGLPPSCPRGRADGQLGVRHVTDSCRHHCAQLQTLRL
jgi:hypothetical protein